MMGEGKERLWTRNYIFVCIAAFMMAFSFFILVPTLPFYLKSVFGIGHTMIGVVLSCYVVAVLSVRPFAGFIADMLPRKKVYKTPYGLFVVTVLGHIFRTSSLAMLIVPRILHGFSFGTLTTTGNTLVIDVMPSSRRGEGLGYFGVMGNLAMAFGPMTGLFIIESGDYTVLFSTSLITGIIGFIFAASVRPPKKAVAERPSKVISLDRFILTSGIPACISLFMLSIPYGMTTNYIAMYAIESGITSNSGLFFSVMAAGLIASRLNSGRRVDRGFITQTIRLGIMIALVGAVGEVSLSAVAAWSIAAGYAVYFISAFLFGYGFGTMFPAFNTLFINLAPNSMRATANATYLTGWDVGIGCGMLVGGMLSEYGYAYCYAAGVILISLSLLFFIRRVTPHFAAHRLR